MSIVTRFAPSPTGYLHLGHALSALTGWRRAREAGGRFLLRIEDIDPGRCRPEFAAAIEADLAWLGLDWDGPVRVQSQHLAEYRAVLDTLEARGLLYPCFCTRAVVAAEVAASAGAPHAPTRADVLAEVAAPAGAPHAPTRAEVLAEVAASAGAPHAPTRADVLAEVAAPAGAPHAPDGGVLYPGTCRRLSVGQRAARIAAGDRCALRLDMARALAEVPGRLWFEEAAEGPIACDPDVIACDPALFGDVVLARKDAPASYHLCVTHDDALQGVTLVTRGEDLKPATHLHRLLQALMGWPAPRYAHHRLLTDAAGRRLAKRDKAATLRDLRAAGLSPEAVRALAES